VEVSALGLLGGVLAVLGVVVALVARRRDDRRTTSPVSS
jgi:hypothetical protein